MKKKWSKDWKRKLVDIILFGSAAKGKNKPNDIDLALIFRGEIDLSLFKEIQELMGEKYHISILSIDNFFSKPHSLVRTLLLEGKSLITGKNLAEAYGLSSKLLFTYNLSAEIASKKVRFVYLLRGRHGVEGLVKKWCGEFISNNAFLISTDKDNEIREVFDIWKIKYQRKKFLLMG